MNIAIFLGAGASKAEGAPTQGELFKDFFNIEKPNSNIDIIQQRLQSFFKSFFQLDVTHQNKTINYPTFEEVLGIIDIAEMKNDSFGKYQSNIYENNRTVAFSQIKKDLILMLAYVLHEKLLHYTNDHLHLVNHLNNIGMLSKTTFITTNYDILIDNAHRDVFPDVLLDYGIDFSNNANNWRNISHEDKTSNLFKLRGSLNWLYCSNCNDIELTQYTKGAIWLINKRNLARCRNCTSLRLPVIIPPTYFKDFSNIFINNIWLKAEIALRKVDHIFFSGYSLPDADIHVKYLLKRVQQYRCSRELPFEITVFNNHSNKNESLKKEESERYKRFFGANVKYTDYSFTELKSQIESYLYNQKLTF
jgi:NAD-dependent SIR2 family protein deacetylase